MGAKASSEANAAPRSRSDPPGAIFTRFLKFGALAWGGPAAQIAMIKSECVDEEGWVDEETFKKTLAVYQVLPGPEAHELCVYFGRIRGGKLGGFLAGLGFMLPGFLLMLGLSVLYVEADLARQLDELFYGLKAAVGAIIARALVRLSRSFITDVPLALLAAAAFALTVLASAPFALVLLGAGLAYELWTNGARWARQAHSVAVGPVAMMAVAGGAVTLSLTGEIFWEGLKAGVVTFGGAFTVIPYLHDAAVDGQRWLTEGEFVDGLAMSGVLPAPLIIFSTFVGYLAGGLAGPRHDARDLPARLRPPDLLPPMAGSGRRESPHPAVPARSCRSGDRTDRRGHRGHRGRKRGGRPHGDPRRISLHRTQPLARKARRRRRRAWLRSHRRRTASCRRRLARRAPQPFPPAPPAPPPRLAAAFTGAAIAGDFPKSGSSRAGKCAGEALAGMMLERSSF